MRALGMIGVLLLVAACSVEALPSDPPVSPGETGAVPLSTPFEPAGPPPADPAAGLPYVCAGNPFDVGILSQPAVAHLGGDAAAAALRERTSLDGLNRGWWLTYRSATGVEFMAVNGPDLFDYIRFRARDGKWDWNGEGDCAIRFVAAGTSTLRWRIDESAPPAADTRVIRALVDQQCASVDIANLQAPIVRFTDEAVLIVFIASQPASLGADATLGRPSRSRTTGTTGSVRVPKGPLFDHCGQGPPVPVEVDLGEPLGDRRLVDGATWPARDARQPLEP